MLHLEPKFSVVMNYKVSNEWDRNQCFDHTAKDFSDFVINAICPYCNVYTFFFERNYRESYHESKLSDTMDSYRTIYRIGEFRIEGYCPSCYKDVYITAKTDFKHFFKYPEKIKLTRYYGKVLSIEAPGFKTIKQVFKPSGENKSIYISDYIPVDYSQLYHETIKNLETNVEHSFGLTKQIMRQFFTNNFDLDSNLASNLLVLKFIEIYIKKDSLNFKLIQDLISFRWENTDNIIDLKEATLHNLKVLFDIFNIFFIYPEWKKDFIIFIEKKIKKSP